MNLKNLWCFYLSIILPFVGLVLLSKYHYIGNSLFVLGLALFIFIYHPLISGLRLVQAGKIKRSEFYRNFIPMWNFRYFNFLFFNA
jgi:hypothetical protein